jgi:hypothetical protein
MTQFINPDKYYLFLQAGLEVISTPIPQARFMAGRIHVASSAEDAAALVRRIESEPAFRRNVGPDPQMTWRSRAREFIEMLRCADAPPERPALPVAEPVCRQPTMRSAPVDRSYP